MRRASSHRQVCPHDDGAVRQIGECGLPGLDAMPAKLWPTDFATTRFQHNCLPLLERRPACFVAATNATVKRSRAGDVYRVRLAKHAVRQEGVTRQSSTVFCEIICHGGCLDCGIDATDDHRVLWISGVRHDRRSSRLFRTGGRNRRRRLICRWCGRLPIAGSRRRWLRRRLGQR